MRRSAWLKKFCIHPISIILWTWLLWVLGPIVAINYLLAVLLHEMGHYFVAKRLGYILTKFSFSPYGVSLSYSGQNLIDSDEIKIAIAGPLANFFSAFCILAVWWIFPSAYFFTESFVYVSVLLALVNFLPAYPLDGGRIFVCFSSKHFGNNFSKKITIILNLIFATAFLVLFCIFCFVNFNPSYLIFAVFLFVGCLDFKQISKYEKINIFAKKSKNFAKAEVLIIDENVALGEVVKKINLKKEHVFCLILNNGKVVNLSEKMIIKLSENFSFNTKLSEIIKNK